MMSIVLGEKGTVRPLDSSAVGSVTAAAPNKNTPASRKESETHRRRRQSYVSHPSVQCCSKAEGAHKSDNSAESTPERTPQRTPLKSLNIVEIPTDTKLTPMRMRKSWNQMVDELEDLDKEGDENEYDVFDYTEGESELLSSDIETDEDELEDEMADTPIVPPLAGPLPDFQDLESWEYAVSIISPHGYSPRVPPPVLSRDCTNSDLVDQAQRSLGASLSDEEGWEAVKTSNLDKVHVSVPAVNDKLGVPPALTRGLSIECVGEVYYHGKYTDVHVV